MSIQEHVNTVKETIAAAARAAGRDPGEITLCAATKVQTDDTIRQAIAAGIAVCGENRVQELTAHLAAGAYAGAQVHFIGHLQTNKVKQVVGKAALIHSVDSQRLLQAIDSQAGKLGLVQDILLEVNIAGEESKGGCTPQEAEELAALAESYSDHPISRSLKEAYGKELDASRVSNVEELSGRGVRATVDGRQICAGNDKLMEDIGVSWHPCHRVGTTVHVASDGVYLGHIVISDEVKPDAKEAITALKACGVRRTVMLTGDAKAVGESVAQELGLDEVHTQLLPADKVTRVEALLGEVSPKGALAFVGDGINDAPVLSRADIGIAMGGLGSDAAIEAADIVLMDDKPSKLADAIRIARRTLAIVRQNIVFALAVKFLVLALSAAGVANMWEAVFADVGVSVIAILNAMRALKTVK